MTVTPDLWTTDLQALIADWELRTPGNSIPLILSPRNKVELGEAE